MIQKSVLFQNERSQKYSNNGVNEAPFASVVSQGFV